MSRTMLSSCSCDMLAMRPSMVSIIAGLLRSIAAICRIWAAAGSAPPAAGLGIDAGTAAGWLATSVITGLDTAAPTGICGRRREIIWLLLQCRCSQSELPEPVLMTVSLTAL